MTMAIQWSLLYLVSDMMTYIACNNINMTCGHRCLCLALHLTLTWHLSPVVFTYYLAPTCLTFRYLLSLLYYLQSLAVSCHQCQCYLAPTGLLSPATLCRHLSSVPLSIYLPAIACSLCSHLSPVSLPLSTNLPVVTCSLFLLPVIASF